jgi:uncharacterized protein (DUF1015 family)
MPAIHPFRAVQYHNGAGDVSDLVAPPYDVLGADDKAALLAKNPKNIVSVDLPHVPPKELGPPRPTPAPPRRSRRCSDGSMSRRETPAIFAYRQTFEAEGQTFKRTGMACTLDTVSFGPREGAASSPTSRPSAGPRRTARRSWRRPRRS